MLMGGKRAGLSSVAPAVVNAGFFQLVRARGNVSITLIASLAINSALLKRWVFDLSGIEMPIAATKET
jgi:hypothetical protein